MFYPIGNNTFASPFLFTPRRKQTKLAAAQYSIKRIKQISLDRNFSLPRKCFDA